MREQEADRLAVVCTADGLSKGSRDINGVQLGADLLLVVVGDSVGDNDLGQDTVVDDLDGLAAQDTVCDNGVHLQSTVLGQGLGCQSKSSTSIGHVVDQNGNLSLDISNQHHARNLVSLLALLVDQSKVQVEAIGNRSGTMVRTDTGKKGLSVKHEIRNVVKVRTYDWQREQNVLCQSTHAKIVVVDIPLSSTSIGRDNDTVLVVGDLLSNVLESAGLGIQVIDGDVEESLDLGGMEIHGNNVVGTSNGEHVGDQLGSDGGARLVLLVLASIGEARNDGSDAAGRGSLAGIDHDQELHEVVVDLAASGLDNEDILVTDRLSDGDRGLLVGVLEDNDLGELGSETANGDDEECIRVSKIELVGSFCCFFLSLLRSLSNLKPRGGRRKKESGGASEHPEEEEQLSSTPRPTPEASTAEDRTHTPLKKKTSIAMHILRD